MRLRALLGRLMTRPASRRPKPPGNHIRRLYLATLEDRTVPAPIVLANGTEPFVTVDPNNANNVAVGANSFGATFSTDGGQTFGALTSPAGYRGDSGLAVDSQGRVFSSYLITDSANPPMGNLLDIAVSNTTFAAQTLSSPGVVISTPRE